MLAAGEYCTVGNFRFFSIDFSSLDFFAFV
jgi:hypothetical protein